jgi:hypothetical protein
MFAFALSRGLLLFVDTCCNTDCLLVYRLCGQHCCVSVVNILRRKVCTELVGQDSSVGIATCYGLEGPGIESRLERDFPYLSRQALVPVHPPVRWVPGIKRPGRGLDHRRLSSAEVKERVELYLNSSSGPSWPVLRRSSHFTHKTLFL